MRPLRTLELEATEWKYSSAGSSDGQVVSNMKSLASVLDLNLVLSFHGFLHVSVYDGTRDKLNLSSRIELPQQETSLGS